MRLDYHKTMATIGCAYILGFIVVWGTIIYVAAHFIMKFW